VKAKLKSLLIAVGFLTVATFYIASDYIWSARTKSEAPTHWTLIHEDKMGALAPWTWFFPPTDSLYFLKSPPRRIDPQTVNGEIFIVAEVAALYKNEGAFDSFYVVSPDRKASHSLSDNELEHFRAGRISMIQFDWQVYKGDHVRAAIIQYCTDHAIEEGPELAPHFPEKQFYSVGVFHNNYAYIQQFEGGALGSELADKHYVARVVTARESVAVLFHDSKTRHFTVWDPFEAESKEKQPKDLNFQAVDPEGIIGKAWSRASNPKLFPKDFIKGRTQTWVFVGAVAAEGQGDKFYVGTEIKTDPKSGFQFVPLLKVSEEWFIFHLDPKGKKFAPVRSDLFWIELEELTFQDITPGGIGESVLNLVRPKKPE
jgi:hypothetical protein